MISEISTCIPEPKASYLNPSQENLRDLVSLMPNSTLTEFGNYNVTTEVLARSKASTFIVTDTPENHSDQCISKSEGDSAAKIQNDFIKNEEMIIIDGYIGADLNTRVSVRLIVEKRHANIAAMQQQLYFPVTDSDVENFTPDMHVIYTPSLKIEGYPNDRLIAVDLDNNVTRIFNSDYFGESKKAGLRMWNKIIYDQGGLAMHAGCKVIPTKDGEKFCLIIGLSGTGKTTTTFTNQNGSIPIQDDFVALMQDGTCRTSENGCFAKTFGLDEQAEPIIYNAVTKRNSFLENVSLNQKGEADFFDTSYTQNGRATFPFKSINAEKIYNIIPRIDFILILNKSENVIPAVAKLTTNQAAIYFMLGETMGTSAGGVEEAGKSLRIPGTNPFFPLLHGQQGSRFLELTQKHNIDTYLMNTGRIGGSDATPISQKVKINHSSAIVKAIAEGGITWKRDEEFGYNIADQIPDFPMNDDKLLDPKRFYEDAGQSDAYKRITDQIKCERSQYLSQYGEIESISSSI